MPCYRSDDGLELHYLDTDPAGPTGADGGQPPILLHHGFSASGLIDWVEGGVVAALGAAGRRVIVPDARGHGHSEKPLDPARYGQSRLARDLRTLLDTLGIRRVDLAGYSMGAVVCLLATAAEPRVRRLVVGGIGAAAVELGGLDTRVLATGQLVEALQTDDPSRLVHPVAVGFRNFVDSTGADRRALAAAASAAEHDPLPLAEVRVPTLVLAGRADPLAPRPQALADALPDARLQLVPGDHGQALHCPEFREALVGFLTAP